MLIKNLKESASFITSNTSLRPKLAITLGSGLSSFVDQLDIDVAIPYSDIPHFAPATVAGHPGQLVIGKIQDREIAVLQGRIHFYEGHSWNQVIYPTRVLKQIGVTTLTLTNAAGGFGDSMQPGDLMVITDHINLTGYNPLIGTNHEELGPRFPDMSEVYSKTLNEKLISILKQKNIRFDTGIYCGVLGPSYETPAEIQYLKAIGGKAVGMSTVPEAIAAKHANMTVVGMSCITNLASGISPVKLDHKDVKDVAKTVESQFNSVLIDFFQSPELA